MEFAKCLVLLCLAYASGAQHEHGDHKVQVKVYYESLCPDSQKFITTQLHPALADDDLARHVNLTLIPYGKSETQTGATNDYNFTCHHGAAECQGNKLHACALKTIKDLPDSKKSGFNRVTVDFVNCLIGNFTKKETGEVDFHVKECAETTNVPNMAEITNCADSNAGSEYLAMYGKQTNSFQKPLASVPTIVFDDSFEKTKSLEAQVNFARVLCKHIDHDKPKICSGAATLSTAAIGILFFVLMGKIF